MTACPGSDRRLKLVGVVAGMLLGWVLAFASPASAVHNNFRINAVPVAAGNNSGEDNIGYTEEAGEQLGESPLCPFPYGATGWYVFSAPANGTLTVQTITGAENFGNGDGFLDTNLAIYPGSSVSSPLACNDEDPSSSVALDSRVDIPVAAGGIYGIQVGGIDYLCCGVEEGDFQLLVNFQAAPAAPPPAVLDADVVDRWQVFLAPSGSKLHNKTKIKKFRLKTEQGSTAEIECKGDCKGIKKATGDPRSISGTALNLKQMFRSNQLLAAGTKIKLLVTKPGEIGKFFKFKIRARKLPKTRECRLQPSGGLTNCQVKK